MEKAAVRRDLRDMSLPELRGFMEELGEPGFRALQIFGWISRGATGFRDMLNLPEALRRRLAETAFIGVPDVLAEQRSLTDGTAKFLLGLRDGSAVECVFMKYKFGNSVCISSQAGCRMGCRFCASTRLGLARGLSAGEMYSELLTAEKETGGRISRIVVMGTGEPFDNYEELSGFIQIVNAPEGLNIGMRSITVSTCGIVPAIDRFAGDFPQVNLAISLHAADDRLRSSIMPVNERWPISELIAAARRYTERTGRRVTFEYALINGQNSSDADAERLVALLSGLLCHVNLIPLNKVKGSGFDTVSKRRARVFRDILERHHIPATVRRELGADIDAACGQLRLRRRKENREVSVNRRP